MKGLLVTAVWATMGITGAVWLMSPNPNVNAEVPQITKASSTNVYIEDKVMKSHAQCVLQAGFTLDAMRNKGVNPIKIVDSASDQSLLYKISLKGKTGFVSCQGKEYKVWVMN